MRVHLQGRPLGAHAGGRARKERAMTRRRWGLAALGIMLMGWVIGGEWVSIHQHVPENHFIDALGGLSFLAAGLVALDRRPGNAIGKLMIAYVVVSYLGNWGEPAASGGADDRLRRPAAERADPGADGPFLPT